MYLVYVKNVIKIWYWWKNPCIWILNHIWIGRMICNMKINYTSWENFQFILRKKFNNDKRYKIIGCFLKVHHTDFSPLSHKIYLGTKIFPFPCSYDITLYHSIYVYN